jgi:hypothetical protein
MAPSAGFFGVCLEGSAQLDTVVVFQRLLKPTAVTPKAARQRPGLLSAT